MSDLTVSVNVHKCSEVAEIISLLRLKPEFYQREYLRVDAGEETSFRMHFFVVAICHHTYSLHHPSLNLYGWDFLEHVFIRLAKNNSPLLDTAFLAEANTINIKEQLCEAFSHGPDLQNCTLDRLDERAGLMKEAGLLLTEKYDGGVVLFFDRSEGRLEGNNDSIYPALAGFEAYSDPHRKKSTFLIKLLQEAGLIDIQDPENFVPIMDYHMQRVLLRLGCVEIQDDGLKKKLINRTPTDSDEPVRGACIQAFRVITGESGYPVIRLNDIFWSLGRSCCNQTMLCQDGVCEKNPCTFEQIVKLQSHQNCVFKPVCKGAHNSSYRKLWQPVVETHYY